MSQSLQDRRVFLTGASRGVGFAIAKSFLEKGARIIGVGRDEKRLLAAADALKNVGEFYPLLLDLRRPGIEKDAVGAVARHFGGRLDVLFNNAGVMVAQPGFEGEAAGALEESMQVNVLSPHNLIRVLLPALLAGREPRVINTSSGAGNFASVAGNNIASYRVTKFALNGLTLNWAEALKGRVAVNAFDPGWVKSDMGGSMAPGTVEESAKGAFALVTTPFDVTGKFWKNGQEISW